ncbi:MAG: DoxX family protein [Gemmatimonadota bacterium]
MVELFRSLLRIVAGLLFMQHGAQKLFGWFGGNAVASWFAFPLGVAGLLEFFGGILILIGLFTRPVAFILAGQMAVAFWWRHYPNGVWPIQNGGEPAVLFCFIFLYLAVVGGGRYGIDGWRKRRR